MSSLEQIEALELKLNSVDLTDDNNLKPLEIIKKKKDNKSKTTRCSR